MSKSKDNICKHCKAVNSHYSFQCYTVRTPLAKSDKPINKVSEKRKKENTKYAKLSTGFKILNPYCMARLDGCTGTTSDVHHLYPGCHRSKYYLVMSTWITVCPNCHHLIHDVLGKDELIEKGLKLTE